MKGRKKRVTGLRLQSGVVLFVSIGCLAVTRLASASIAGDVRRGARAFEQKKYAESLKAFEGALKRDPQSPLLNYNAGTAFYKEGDYANAVNHFQPALLADDKGLRQRAHYNLGNSFYQQAIAVEEDNIDEAITNAARSITQFEQAIELDPNDEASSLNESFVKKELIRLQEKKARLEREKNKSCPLGDKEKKNNDKDEDQQQQQSQESNEEQQGKGSKEDEQNSPGDQDRQQRARADEAKDQDAGKQGVSSEKERPSSMEQEEKKDAQEAQKSPARNKSDETGSPFAARAFSGDDGSEVSAREARMLLDKYERNEEPKDMLFLKDRRFWDHPVEKDW